MKTQFKVAGLSFRVKDCEAIRKHVPSGDIELRHVPFKHETNSVYDDPNAVEVWNGDIHLGYMPKGSPERRAYFEAIGSGIDVTAKIVDFSYAIYDGNLNIMDGTFNDELDGYLASVVIEFESAVSSTHYTIDGDEHIRATMIANLIDNVGFVLPEFLYNWMTSKKIVPRNAGYTFEAFDNDDESYVIDRIPMSYKEYLAKIEEVRVHGNALHDACELFSNTGTVNANTPHGLAEMFTKFSIKPINTEQVVRRGRKYRVAGRYDLLAEVTNKAGKRIRAILDWKRGSSVKLGYLLQCAFYARQTKADEFWIVLFGTKNKCGYSIKMFNKDDIDKLCKVFDMLTKIAYELSSFKEFKAIK